MDDDDIDMDDGLMDMDDVTTHGIARWLPRVVVVATLIGFVSLAWYAYQTGTQSIKEEDLVIVEADDSPIKERPEDPGGMKFPNQDKTVFETFAGNAQTPPKVERVMPPPEEPMQKQLDLTETKTWVNEELKNKEETATKAEQLIGSDAAPVLVEKPSTVDAMPVASTKNIVSYTKDKTKVNTPVKSVEVSVANVKAKPVVIKKEEPKAATPSAGSVKIQLGAYRSESEARSGFTKIQKKFSSLSGKSPLIIKADLGAKGIYYRLRVSGFASDSEAKKFCGSLSAKGQPCILAK